MELKISFFVLSILSVPYNCKAGHISDSFLSSFASPYDTKDAILEFTPVFEKIFSHSSLNSLSGDERRNEIVTLSKEYTAASQLPVLNVLTTLGLRDQATPFWIANRIAIKNAPLSALQALAAVPGPFTIRESNTVTIFPIVEMREAFYHEQPFMNVSKRQSSGATPQSGVAKIRADVAQANGINGTGVVIAIIDTGVNPNHVALKSNYKNNQWSFKDAVNNKTEAYDDNGHGTHCMGTMVGTVNGIGVAPGAQWIACKALSGAGGGTEAQLIACGQFIACPNNSTGNCTDLPDIVSNSWGGGNDSPFYNDVVKMWRALNIIPFFAIGNAGPKCGSANSPGDQPNLISVGSTDPNDTISEFSSRGPGGPVEQRLFGFFIGDDKLTIKPEISAPGRNITSADTKNTTGYITYSGTSMATPHAAGAAALILSTDKTLGFDGVKQKLENSAVKLNASKKCPFWKPPTQPNNDFGNGRIDCVKALGIVGPV